MVATATARRRNDPVNPATVFTALSWQIAPWKDKSPIVLLTGSAGGGKSRLAAEKLHGYCLKYPGAMALMVRKTRESMNNSTVLFVDRRVIGSDPRVRHLQSRNRFEYRNGSILAYGGMKDEDQRQQIRSIGQDGGLDIVWMEEAIAFSENDFQEIMPRMRGKAGGWSQIILTTNPDAPTHWINRRLIMGKEAAVYFSRAADNPKNPPEYQAWLDKLAGMQRQRLRDGLWVQAEGVIYDNFEVANITTDADYQAGLPLLWGVDDGYAYGEGPGTASYHPRVVLLAQVTPLGGLNVFAEYVKTGVADYQDTINEVKALGYPDPDLAYVDSSAAMFRGALSNASIYNVGATHKVEEGIRNVRRLICDGSGVRLLKIHPRCANLIRELQSYRYDDGNGAANGERKPLKVDDHVVDAVRYMAQHLKGSI